MLNISLHLYHADSMTAAEDEIYGRQSIYENPSQLSDIVSAQTATV